MRLTEQQLSEKVDNLFHAIGLLTKEVSRLRDEISHKDNPYSVTSGEITTGDDSLHKGYDHE